MSKNTRFIAVTVSCIALLTACSRHEQTPGKAASAGSGNKVQRHSGKLLVNILPQSPTSGDDLMAVFSGGSVSAWRWQKNSQAIDDQKGPKLPKNLFSRGDTISVTAISGGQEGTATVTIANSPPEIRSARFTPDYICRGTDITAAPEGVDGDGDEITYKCRWIVNGEETPDESVVLKGDRFKCGDNVKAAITPYDSYGPGKTFRTQAITIPRAAPRFVSVPPVTFRGRIYTYNAVAKDPDGGSITYSLSSAPPGMTIDAKTGRITWPIDGKSGGTHPIEIVAQNSDGVKVLQQYSLDITLQPGASE